LGFFDLSQLAQLARLSAQELMFAGAGIVVIFFFYTYVGSSQNPLVFGRPGPGTHTPLLGKYDRLSLNRVLHVQPPKILHVQPP
jgi:hypothetical protein